MINTEGVSMAEIKHRGGWAKKSSVPANYYIRSTANSRGALAIGNEDLSKNSINIVQTKIVIKIPGYLYPSLVFCRICAT